MKILLYVNTKQNLKKTNKLGGIEILNYDLYNFLSKKHFTILTNSLSNKIINIDWDILISSNDANIFDLVKTKRKILWLHNKLQIEKAFRKKQLFSLLSNNIEAIFVSKYLNDNTSRLYGFKKRVVIPNFLPNIFENKKDIKNLYSNKKKIVWSVQRDRGLDKIIKIWINKVNSINTKIELHIFAIDRSHTEKFKKYNIFFHGRVSRHKLINFYKKSLGMICLGYDETFCLNAIEGMKMGLPVISLGETALKDIIIDKKNGLIVNNIDDIHKAILNLINLSHYQRKKISESSVKFAKNFDSKSIFQKWNNFISS